MSQVLKALEQSELSRQNKGSTQSSPVTLFHQLPSFSWWSKASLTALLAPSILCCGYLVYHSYQTRIDELEQLKRNAPQVVPQEGAYQVLEYPDLGELQTNTPRVKTLTETRSAQPFTPLYGTQLTTRDQQDKNADQEFGLNDLDLSQLSPELIQRVELAIQGKDQVVLVGDSSKDHLLLTEHLDTFSGRIPALNFQTHVYSSRTDKRWVKINGVERKVGDDVANGVQLVEINPQSTLIRFGGELIEVPALYDWKG
ncbi:general secretion pathway protein GspB [Vibrio ordalii]|jgi:general secretion pathway protein B|uniref:general secretion pathway protein GspB n=1 Tax=Vibrio ordalii TaxID=28174 RepID=UPI0002483595|nr:general secretion pathway protein GspB [Vibrio ordalii]